MALWNRNKPPSPDDPSTDPEDDINEPSTGSRFRLRWPKFPGRGGAQAVPEDDTNELSTGSRPRLRWPRFSGRDGAPTEVEESDLTPLERQRKLVESFQEDQLELTDRVKLKAAKLASIVLPLIAVYAIGGELGQYFAGNVAFSWTNQWVMSQYLIGYAGEFALAVLTYILGYAFLQHETGTSHNVKLSVTFLVWFLFLMASAAGQWYVAKATLRPNLDMELSLKIRIGMACCLDVAAVCLMWWRGKSLAKFLEQQAKKAESIRAVNESELAISAAQEAAERRRKEDEEYLNAKRSHNNMIIRLQELQNAALIRQAEQALLPEEGGSSRNRSSW